MATTTTTDRVAIEALTRAQTDDDWVAVFEVALLAPGTSSDWVLTVEECRALIAHLDEVLEGLSKTMQERLRWLDEGRVGWVIFSKRDLLHRAGLFDNRAAQTVTPFGRAVLKRRQDMLTRERI